MNDYESMILLDPNLEDAKVDEVIEKVSASIAKDGGEVLSVDRWGKRSLAYEIKKFSRAHYVLLNFKAEPEKIKKIERMYKLSEPIIRCLTTIQEAADIQGAPQDSAQ